MRVRFVIPGLVAVAAFAVPAPSASADVACIGDSSAVTTANQADAERSLACLVNAWRAENGLPAVSMDTRLGAAARGWSEYIAATHAPIGHYAPDGSGPGERIAAAGYPGGGWGEIVTANDCQTAYGAFASWRHSPGHNGLMLASWDALGPGLAYEKDVDGNEFGIGTVDFGEGSPADTSETALGLQFAPLPAGIPKGLGCPSATKTRSCKKKNKKGQRKGCKGKRSCKKQKGHRKGCKGKRSCKKKKGHRKRCKQGATA